jgi:hypothetical protein
VSRDLKNHTIPLRSPIHGLKAYGFKIAKIIVSEDETADRNQLFIPGVVL